MERRSFIRLSAAVSALAAGNHLPLLAAGTQSEGTTRNIFTEPSAIEPLTGFLPEFSPVGSGSMKGDFDATFELLHSWSSVKRGAGEVARFIRSGSLDISSSASLCTVRETRFSGANHGGDKSIVSSSLRFSGKYNSIDEWKLTSEHIKEPEVERGFTETGSWDGRKMTVQSDMWTQTSATSLPLISQWTLLPLLASGGIKQSPLRFDMLENSTLKPGQHVRYCGKVDVPVSGGELSLDSYVQTGYGILPTHYLVDSRGAVQLITQESVSWALQSL